MASKTPISIFWFRRDLRLDDNAALFHALKSNYKVLPLFIFDTAILDKLEDRSDRRVTFIYLALQSIQAELAKIGSSLLVKYGNPAQIWAELMTEFDIKEAFTNHDYEPYARKRDRSIFDFLAVKNIKLNTFKDQCIFEYKEVLKDDGKPYTIFTPYSRKWKSTIKPFYLKSYPTEKYFSNFLQINPFEVPSLENMGFQHSGATFPSAEVKDNLITNYTEQRNFPAIEGTSRLSVHLRFGTVSIRNLAQKAYKLNETWLNELIWRDFYMMILWHFPHAAESAFRPEYNNIEWLNNEADFQAWCDGKTGYPIVDAGMRELNSTGFMHNRVRMIVASFLTKHLLIDWRWGEAYFAKKLLDFDLSANNGGWQWASGSGCDAAPYFRVFNPTLQTEKFDKNWIYIKKWIPEVADPFRYPKPIVNHEFARKRVLEAYQKGLGKGKTN
ncbi:MAG: cryptochrome/photolyase family protein [Cytophagales bacterium]